MAQYRLVLSAGGYDENDQDLGLIAGAKLAAKDWFTWLFMALHFWLIGKFPHLELCRIVSAS